MRRAKKVGALLGVASALAASGACLFPSLERFETASPDGGGGGREAGTPTTTNDSGDGGRPQPFCASVDAAMCVDFSEVDPLGPTYWNFLDDLRKDAGFVQVVDGGLPTSPEGLVALTNPDASSNLRLYRRFVGSPKRFSIRARLFSPDKHDGRKLRAQSEGGPSVDCEFFASITSFKTASLDVRTPDKYLENEVQIAQSYGVWHDVTLAVDYVARKATLLFDDATPKVVDIPTICQQNDAASLGIGVVSSDEPRTTIYDDVVIRIER